MAVEHVVYEAPGWGIGELVLDSGVVVWHDSPRPRPDEARGSHPLVGRLLGYFAGSPGALDDVDVDLDWCTPFQRSVALALRRVPYGETVTYGELAALAGHPNAHRAAGTFCARNRIGVLIPCHRVVAAGGLGSYGSLGVDYKRRLLRLEHAL